MDIFDVFGAASQTVQGADILASLTGALVVMPDWFGEGNEMKNEVGFAFVFAFHSVLWIFGGVGIGVLGLDV